MPRKPDAYTVTEAAQVLGRSPKRVRQLIAQGALSVVEGSSPQRIPATQVHARMKAQASGASVPGRVPVAPVMTAEAFQHALQAILAQQRELVATERAALEIAHARLEAFLKGELERLRAETEQYRADADALREELGRLQAERMDAVGRRWFRKRPDA